MTRTIKGNTMAMTRGADAGLRDVGPPVARKHSVLEYDIGELLTWRKIEELNETQQGGKTKRGSDTHL